jgi:hypothetical protein
MVVGGSVCGFGGVGEADAMVLVEMFMSEDVGCASGNHCMSMRNANCGS